MLALDHIIIPSHNPQQAAEEFAAQHSIHITKGGRHADWGTFNYLAYFQNNVYIEWIGIEQMDLAEKSNNPLIQQIVRALENSIERPIQYALRTRQMDQYIEHLGAMNLPYSGPVTGSRKRPDGSLLEWRMLFPLSPTKHPFPFLIEWGNQPNIPTDPYLINTQTISSITDQRPNITSFQTAFHLPAHRGTELAKLENSHLYVADGDHLSFSIKI